MKAKLLGLLVVLNAAWVFAGCGNPDSSVICSAESRESVFARSRSESQLATLHADSMKLLARADLRSEYSDDPGYPPIPKEFTYLNPEWIDTYSGKDGGAGSNVSILIKGCMDEFIGLYVHEGDIVLTCGLGGAPNIGDDHGH